jgi:dipeptidyl aminopeptidase/acylaminoacyl peptidase
MIDLECLLRIPFVDPEGSFDISPDGSHLAFAWNITSRWEIYQLDLNASDTPQLVSSPKGASADPGAKLAPKYSPDGSRLAYAVDYNGGENFHIFVQDLKTGSHSDLTSNINYAIQPNFCWSPDGTQIAFLADQSGCFDTYVMPASGGKPRLLLANGFPAWNVRWSPDGCYLAVMCEGKGQDYGVYIISLDGGQPFPIADERGQINALNPAWSPDGTKLAFHSDILNGFHQIGIFDVYTRQIFWLTGGEANCRVPAWTKVGMKLTYVRAQGASNKVVVHSLDGPKREFQIETGVHYKPRFTPDGKGVLFTFNNPRHPSDIWMLITETGELRQVTNSLSSNGFAEHPVRVSRSRSGATKVATTDFIMPQEITYPGMDGTSIPALLFKSENAGEITPGVIVIHGGPSWHFQVEWYPFMTHLASRGWTVLAPNYRGSTGYGRNWQLANRFKLGGVDTNDVAAGVRYLLENRLVDPQRIAVTGRSHGGYLTMSCMTHYPDLWCAGSAVVPFLNWFTAHKNSREDLQHWDLQNFGNPKNDYDLWYESSPFFFLDRVKVPVQLICGENDPRCPASESIQARDKLLGLGKEVDFHLYLDEGHAFLKTENVVDAEVRRVNFLAKALE